ncbi:MAG: NAD(P)H-dependent oxidoreductase [Synergistaceae bacterium]
MKIVVFNGSPRPDGMTKKLIMSITDGFKTSIKDLELDIVDVFSLPISGCYHCNACKSNGGKCVADDVSTGLIDKIERADMVIFASPVYWCGVSSQLKAVIDKMYSRADTLRTMNKKMGIIVAGEAPVSDSQYGAIKAQFDSICEYLNWSVAFFAPYGPKE